MKRLLHLVLAAVAVLLLVTACNKPTSETSQYVTDSQGRRLVSKIEIETIRSNGIEYCCEIEFEYDKNLRLAIVRKKGRTNDEPWSTEECHYEYFSDRIVGYITQEDYRVDSVVNMIGAKGYIDSCLLYTKGNIYKNTYSYDNNGRLTSIDNETYEWNGDLLSITDQVFRKFHYTYLSDRVNHANIGFVDFGDLYDCTDNESLIKNYFSNFSKGFVSECTLLQEDDDEPYSYTLEYSFDDAGFATSLVVLDWEDPSDKNYVKISYLKK